MTATTRLMQPLPVRPVDGTLGPGRPDEARKPRRHTSYDPTGIELMHAGLVDAIRMTTQGNMHPLPVPTDPTA